MGEFSLARAIGRLIDYAGDEWSFLMGSEYKEKSDNIPGSPRRIYYASMSSYRMYAGGYLKHGGPNYDHNKGYLVIISAEKHYSFAEAVDELHSKMIVELTNERNTRNSPRQEDPEQDRGEGMVGV